MVYANVSEAYGGLSLIRKDLTILKGFGTKIWGSGETGIRVTLAGDDR